MEKVTEKNCETCKWGGTDMCLKTSNFPCLNYSLWEPKEAEKSCLTCEYNYTNFNREECKVCRDYSGWISKNEILSRPVGTIPEALKRPAATPEPMSIGNGKVVITEVMRDLLARDEVGQQKYNTSLKTDNGRDALNDAYQEICDLQMYLKQEIMQRNNRDLESKIIQWAKDRNLYEKSTPESQLSKLHEEIGEWQEEYELGDRAAEQLELGDVYVTLVNLTKIRGYSLKECGWLAYEKIKNRKGRMVNGTFVKEGDL